MKSITQLLVLSTTLRLATAHTRFTTLFVNGKSQGDGTCIRMNMDPSTTTDYIGYVNADSTPGSQSAFSSANMACGVGGAQSVDRTCPLKAGDGIGLLHRLWSDGSRPDVGAIDPSHNGSVAIYMKRMADSGSSEPWSTDAAGDGWFKIAFAGYDESTGLWGTGAMNANGGLVKTTVPADLKAGYYLIRSEVLALQNVVNEHVNPQMYAGCAQVYVDGTGSGAPSNTVAIPGYIQESTPALSYNIYQSTPPAVPFQEFGPAVYGASGAAPAALMARGWQSWGNRPWRVPGSRPPSAVASPVASELGTAETSSSTPVVSDSTSPSTPSVQSVPAVPALQSSVASSVAPSVTSPVFRSTSTKSSATKPTSTPSSSSGSSFPSIIGTCPTNTVLEVANLCLTEIPSWSGDTPGALPKCWAASQACWDTLDGCWDDASPAINANDNTIGCHAWESRCTAIVNWCNAGSNLQGPPDAGKILTKAAVSLTKREMMNSKKARRTTVNREITEKMLAKV